MYQPASRPFSKQPVRSMSLQQLLATIIAAVLFGLLSPGKATAASIPPLPVISAATATANPDLVSRRAELVGERKVLRDRTQQHNVACSSVLEGSPEAGRCDGALAVLTAEIDRHIGASEKFIATVVAAERKLLEAQDKALTQAIERDLSAMRNLGFDRRAQDFEEWVTLGTDARREFEHTVSAEAAGLIASWAKDGIVAGVKKLDEAKVGGWIVVLMKQDPPPTEIIAVLRRMASLGDGDRLKLATDAKYLAKLIENVTKTVKVGGWTDGLPVLLDIVCDVFPAEAGTQCKWFKATANVTVAALYNNAARRIAVNEVERLTSMTEAQLRGLAKLNDLMVERVKDRNEVRTKLKALN